MIAIWVAFCAAVAFASSDALEVTTRLGNIRGVTLKTRLGEDFHAFRGIRYANPPVGPLRFISPQPVNPWKPKVFDATDDGPMCPQVPFNITDYSEDCLRLNVYTKNVNTKALKPVIIFLHPGGYYAFSGQSKNFAGPENLMDRDVVLVTINYRLGTLGFLSTGTAHAPGNAGLKDQVLAMKWVRDHIRNFGGNPNSITLLGYSSGSVSISLHLASPMTKGLFHRAIAVSGSAVSQNEYPADQQELGRRQARLVNCPTNTVDAMITCLRQTPVEEFVKTTTAMFDYEYEPPMKPVIEEDLGQERFLVESPTLSFQAGRIQKIPLVIGMTQFEFVQLGYDIIQNATKTKELNDNWESLAPIYFQYERGTPKSKEVSRVLRKEYLDNKPLVAMGQFEKLGELFSDGFISFGVHRFAHLAARYMPVYYHCFTYKGRYSSFTLPGNKTFGAVHIDDNMYVLPNIFIHSGLFTADDPENTIIERLTRMWTQFANTGNPNNPNDDYLRSLRWTPLNLKEENYLDIGNELVIKNGLFLKRFAVWSSLFPLEWHNQPCRHDDENKDYPEPLESWRH